MRERTDLDVSAFIVGNARVGGAQVDADGTFVNLVSHCVVGIEGVVMRERRMGWVKKKIQLRVIFFLYAKTGWLTKRHSSPDLVLLSRRIFVQSILTLLESSRIEEWNSCSA